MLDMKRREFIRLLGGAAVWPVAAHAQQPAMPVIGYISSLTQADSVHFDAAFRRGLSEMGYVEGQNVSIEYRWITDRYSPLPAMAADLAQRQVAMIGATGRQQCLQRRPQQRRYPSSSSLAQTQSSSALSPASTGRAYMIERFRPHRSCMTHLCHSTINFAGIHNRCSCNDVVEDVVECDT